MEIPVASFLCVAAFGGFVFSAISSLVGSRFTTVFSLVLFSFSSFLLAFLGGAVAVGAIEPFSTHIFDGFFGVLLSMDLFVDRLPGMFLAFAGFGLGLSALFGARMLRATFVTYNIRYAGTLLSLSAIGLSGALLSTTALGFTFFADILLFSSFFLVMAQNSVEARKAALRAFAVMVFGLAAILSALLLLSGGSLTASFQEIADGVSRVPLWSVHGAAALFLFGFGSRLGIMPFHNYVSASEKYAPAHIASALFILNTAFALYGLLRVPLFFGAALPEWFGYAMVIAGLLTALCGVLLEAVESEVKAVLSYGSMRQAGTIFVVLGSAYVAATSQYGSFANAALFAAALIIMTQFLVKPALLLGMGYIVKETYAVSIESLGGLARRMPMFSILMFLFGLADAALPPSAFFMGQWVFFQAVMGSILTMNIPLEAFFSVVLFLLFFMGGLHLFAMVRYLAVVFLGRPCSLGAEHMKEPDIFLRIPLILFAFATILFAFFSPLLNTFFTGRLKETLGDPFAPTLAIGDASFHPVFFSLVTFATALLILLCRYLFGTRKRERMQATWNGGLELSPRMEYTGAAFSSSLRYFFSTILRSNAYPSLRVTKRIATNPWFTTKTFSLRFEPVWEKLFSLPLDRIVKKGAEGLKRLEIGNVQLYVAMVLITLAIAIVIAL